jgi:hypothetical protein
MTVDYADILELTEDLFARKVCGLAHIYIYIYVYIISCESLLMQRRSLLTLCENFCPVCSLLIQLIRASKILSTIGERNEKF